MLKKVYSIAIAAALLAGFSTFNACQAGSTLIQVTDVATFVSGGPLITDITFTFAGLSSPITNPGSDGTMPHPVTTTNGSTTVTETFSPGVSSVTAVVTFDTLVPNAEVPVLSSVIKLSSVTTNVGGLAPLFAAAPSFSAASVPEPASMAMLGIGMAGLLAFRRIRNKIKASA
jgi:hypothetical protein